MPLTIRKGKVFEFLDENEIEITQTEVKTTFETNEFGYRQLYYHDYRDKRLKYIDIHYLYEHSDYITIKHIEEVVMQHHMELQRYEDDMLFSKLVTFDLDGDTYVLDGLDID